MGNPKRIIGRHQGQVRGPLFICLGAMHGNEKAGVQAIDVVLTLLKEEPVNNPGFVFHGRLLGLIGNTRALQSGRRYINEDLNRALTPERVEAVLSADPNTLESESLEIRDLISIINEEIENYKPDRVVLLDIHSTSASGGIFVIAADDKESIRIGTELHAPVILDFAREIAGTTLGYFTKETYQKNIVSVVFECGQHNEPLSVNRAIAAIINCMRTIGCVNAEDVENKYDLLLQEYSNGLPKVARLIERYAIDEDRTFSMVREFKNFESVSAGQIVAFAGDEPIAARHAGLILLPRLQEQGNDGFFIVTPIDLRA